MINSRSLVLGLAAIILSAGLTSCGVFKEKEVQPRLEGDRISILNYQKSVTPSMKDTNNINYVAPSVWPNEYWPQPGGYPNHVMQDLAFDGQLTQQWSSNIGEGAKDSLPQLSTPIIYGNVVFVLDTSGHVNAHDLKTGKRYWRARIKPPRENDNVIGGGIAFGNGRLFVAGGYDEIRTLDPQTGKLLWKAKLNAPTRSAPVVFEKQLYVETVNNEIQALDTETGNVIWAFQGLEESISIVGMASPAANEDVVIAAFSSGEIYALRSQNGAIAWSVSLSPAVRGGLAESIPHIRAHPVLDKGVVFTGNVSGRLAAINLQTGQKIWQEEIGIIHMPYVSGNFLFVSSVSGEVVALNKATGDIVWVTDPKTGRQIEKEARVQYYGPIVAGGRVYVTSDQGEIIAFDPATGNIIERQDIGRAINLPPIVASGKMLIVDVAGTLRAF